MSIDPASSKALNKNGEESKRDVSLEELLNDNSQKRNRRINEDKKSVEKDTRIKKSPRTNKKSLHSTPGEYFYLIIPREGRWICVGYNISYPTTTGASLIRNARPKYRKLK